MKIKMDFVSNSSSTSFVYIAREMLSRDDFLAAVGVGPDSPVAPLFENMFAELKTQIDRGTVLTRVEEVDTLEDRQIYLPAVLNRMKQSIANGETVTVGQFSSENNLAEMTLCTEIFEIDSERFYINAYDNYW
ncbi:hypothetical protein [Aquidulcibacter paucihalophilus]|uniref:hypothetical protein n=1 Tax=Aquidulcibacter paucihalophilus TaxID=1978549 RepID=UPI000A19014B|nr:hypothetical protein [Aquidulcibacter paucihalophilus]